MFNIGMLIVIIKNKKPINQLILFNIIRSFDKDNYILRYLEKFKSYLSLQNANKYSTKKNCVKN
jgi:hypothetical protein